MKTWRGIYRVIGSIWVALAVIVIIISLTYIIFFNVTKNPINKLFLNNFPVFSEVVGGLLREASPKLAQYLGLLLSAFVIYLGLAISNLKGWARTIGIVFHIAMGAGIAMLTFTIYDRIKNHIAFTNAEFVPVLILIIGLVLGLILIALGFQMGTQQALEAFAGVQPQAVRMPVVKCPTCGEVMDVQNERCPHCDLEGEAPAPSSARLVDMEDGTSYMVSIRRPVRIGRKDGDENEDYEVLLPYGEVSSNHAMIEFANGVFILHAQKDTNFTFVNEVQLRDSIIKNGDVVGFGPRRFRFEVTF